MKNGNKCTSLVLYLSLKWFSMIHVYQICQLIYCFVLLISNNLGAYLTFCVWVIDVDAEFTYTYLNIWILHLIKTIWISVYPTISHWNNSRIENRYQLANVWGITYWKINNVGVVFKSSGLPCIPVTFIYARRYIIPCICTLPIKTYYKWNIHYS